MAVVALAATQQIADTGITPSYASGLLTANTYTFPNDGRVFLHLKKSAAVDAVITIVTPNTVRGKAIAESTVTVPASTGDKMIGPFPPDLYNDASGLVTISASDVDGLTVAVVRL